MSDPLWYKRLSIVIAEMLRKDDITRKEFLHNRQLVQLQLAIRSGAGFAKEAELETAAAEAYLNALQCTETQKTTASKSVAAQLRDTWIKVFGDPEDAKVQASIDAVTNSLKKSKLK
jgi:hypothetical protein